VSKKLIIVILLAAVIALAGYFVFNWYRGSSAAWKYIPSNAVVVISSEHLQDSSYTATDAQVDLKRLPLLDIASDNLSLLNLISPAPEKLHQFLKGKSISYSFHPRTSTEWGVILYIPISGNDEAKWLASPNRDNIRVLHHNFQDQKITDVSDSKSHLLFSYMIKDEFLVISYYGDLIEDVVRASQLSIESFQLRFRFAKIPDSDYGTSLYLKTDAWNSVVPLTNEKPNFKEFVKSFPAFQDFHFEKTDESNVLQLSSMGSATSSYYLNSWIQDGEGIPFTGHKHISQQTSFFYRLAVNENPDFKERFLKWHKNNKSEGWNKLNYHIGKESNLFLDNLGSELILCQLEENNSINDGKILLARYSNYDKLRPMLQRLARLSAKESNVSTDRFQGYDIYSIDIPELPSGLFGEMFTGFPRTYITYIAPYLVMSNNAQVLQNYIVDYENQLTWKQSPEFDSVLTDSKSNAQLSLIVNLRKAQSGTAINNTGKSYADFTAKIESALIQCRFDGSKAYPSIALIPKKRPTASKVLNRTFLNIDIEWPVFYDSGLAALQNPLDGSSEILLTDAAHNLLRTNNLRTGKTVTIAKLPGPLVTNAYKVDFLNIGRQQRVVATSNQVYAIDEDDSTVITTFAKTLPSDSPITALFQIDGGDEGSNRFIIKNSNQELYLWESVGKPIRRLSRSARFENIQSPVVTLNQIGNRGFIVTERNGKIYLLGDNGSVKRRFPVDILARTESSFTWTQNPTTGQPELVGVSASGEVIHISLDGKITSRQQLLRPEPGSTFKVIFDQNSLDWILLRTSSSKASIITKEGNELFTIKDLRPNSIIQYHFFGVDNRFISIGSGNYTTVFDMTGRRLGDKAIPSEMPVRLTYQPGYYKLLIFSRSEKKIQVWSIKLR
jgi:DNA-binding beta-propeller fold protein YncE